MVAVLFDFEGTLVQSIEENPEVVEVFRKKLYRKLVSLGIQQGELKFANTSALMQNAALKIIRETFTSQDAAVFHIELNNFLEEFEMDWAVHSGLFSDTRSTLMKLKTSHDLGIVTNTSAHATNTMLQKHRIGEFFGAVVTRDNVKQLKPDSEGIRLALKILKQKEFFFVGDSSYDFIAAKEAGGYSIIVKRDPTKVLKYDPDYVVSSLGKIPTLVKRIVKDDTIPPRAHH